jgi:hypothetical protein
VATINGRPPEASGNVRTLQLLYEIASWTPSRTCGHGLDPPFAGMLAAPGGCDEDAVRLHRAVAVLLRPFVGHHIDSNQVSISRSGVLIRNGRLSGRKRRGRGGAKHGEPAAGNQRDFPNRG